MKNRTKRDWASTVIEDLNSLGMEGYSMDQIKKVRKGIFSNMVKKHCEKLALKSRTHTNDYTKISTTK